MSSPFFYTMSVTWSKNGASGNEQIPVYAFASGVGAWETERVRQVSDVKRVIDMCNGAGMLTLCTFTLYAYRALLDRNIDYFDMIVRDSRDRQTPPTMARKGVAQIRGRDLEGRHMIPIGPENVPKNSGNYVHLRYVPLYFQRGALSFAFI